MLEPGDEAPDFTLPRDGGGDLTLSELRGRKVALYFYPRDDTPGCTTEALDFTAARGAFEAAGTTVVGVSRDPVASHDKFKEKHALDVILLADEDGAVSEAYGAWGEKKMYGKTFEGIIRSTVVIDPKGKVIAHFPKVRVKGHVDKVIEAIADSSSSS
jgi:peroxiredoxin Q/BCP